MKRMTAKRNRTDSQSFVANRAQAAVRNAAVRAYRFFAPRSRSILRFFDMRMEDIITVWILLILAFATVKVMNAPTRPADVWQALGMSLPFLALAAAPVLGYRFAAGRLPSGPISEQPSIRAMRSEAWRPASSHEVSRISRRGPGVFLVSLIVGIVLNVPVRALEFLAIVPAVSPNDPMWVHALVTALTVDAVVMGFAYMVCFVMALRSAPLFPRAMALAWGLDVLMQIGIASYISTRVELPAGIAAPLTEILNNNIYKVAISAAIWAPFLMVSNSVNLVFRRRVRAA